MSLQTYCDKVTGKPAAVVATVLRQALTATSIYFFSPIFHLPEVQALCNDAAYAPLMAAMKLIMYGTFNDIASQTAEVKAIFSPTLTNKLRQLTIVSLASSSRRLDYSTVEAAVGLSDIREIEDLVIDSITEGLLAGRLDQRRRVIEVHECVARDVNLSQLDGMIADLEAWVERCDSVTADLKASQQKTDKLLDAEAARATKRALYEEKMMDVCKEAELKKEMEMEEMQRRGPPPPGHGLPHGDPRAAGGRRGMDHGRR